MNYFVIIGIAFLNFIFQSTILQHFSILGIVPNTSLIIVITFALLAGKKVGSIVGLGVGLLQDIFFSSVIGINMFIYFIIGYLLGLLDEKVFKDNLLLPFSITLIATLGYHIMYYLFMTFLSIDVSFIVMLKNILIKEMIYNSLVSIIIYKKVLKYYKQPNINFIKKMH